MRTGRVPLEWIVGWGWSPFELFIEFCMWYQCVAAVSLILFPRFALDTFFSGSLGIFFIFVAYGVLGFKVWAYVKYGRLTWRDIDKPRVVGVGVGASGI